MRFSVKPPEDSEALSQIAARRSRAALLSQQLKMSTAIKKEFGPVQVSTIEIAIPLDDARFSELLDALASHAPLVYQRDHYTRQWGRLIGGETLYVTVKLVTDQRLHYLVTKKSEGPEGLRLVEG